MTGLVILLGRTEMSGPIGQVEFPKFQTRIFVEWKAPGVSLKLTELETRLSRSLVKLGGGRQVKYQGWEGGSKIE